MAPTFPFKLITPTGIVYEGEVQQVEASGPLGRLGVLADHIDFITSLVPCVLSFRTSEGATNYVISGGLAEVKEGAMTVLADDAQTAAKLDGESVERELEGAEKQLATLSSYEPAYEAAQRELALARARRELLQLTHQ